MRNLSLIVIVLFLVAGCATTDQPPKLSTADEVFAAVTAKTDPYTKTRSWRGPLFELPNGRGTWYLACIQSLGTEKSYNLVVNYWALDWAFLSNATDRNGINIPVLQVDREVRNGVSETIALRLSADYLSESLARGIDVRIDGQRGSIVVFVPAASVEGFMRAVHTLEAK